MNESDNVTFTHDPFKPYEIQTIEKIIFWPIAAVIVFESSSLLLIFCLHRQLRSVTNIFVVSLTMSDLLNGAILLPCVLLLGLAHPSVQPLMMLVLISSMGNVCGCALDRWIAIKYALRYKGLMVKKTCFKILAGIWSFASILAVIPKVLGPKIERTRLFRQVFLGMILSVLTVLSVSLIAAYGYIFQAVRKHIRFMMDSEISFSGDCNRNSKGKLSLKRLRVELQHSKIFAFTTATFIACWFPLIYINFVADVLLLPHLVPESVLVVSLHTIFLHSVINPCLYGFYQKEIRHLIIQTVFKLKRNKSSTFQPLLNIRRSRAGSEFLNVVQRRDTLFTNI